MALLCSCTQNKNRFLLRLARFPFEASQPSHLTHLQESEQHVRHRLSKRAGANHALTDNHLPLLSPSEKKKTVQEDVIRAVGGRGFGGCSLLRLFSHARDVAQRGRRSGLLRACMLALLSSQPRLKAKGKWRALPCRPGEIFSAITYTMTPHPNPPHPHRPSHPTNSLF